MKTSKAPAGGLFWTQFRAVFLKNMALELRQTKLLIFQALPMVVVFLVVGIVTKLRPDSKLEAEQSVLIPSINDYSSFFPDYRSSNWAPYSYTDATGNAGNQTDPTIMPSGPGFLGAIPQFQYNRDVWEPSSTLRYVPFFTNFSSWPQVTSNFSSSFAQIQSSGLFNQGLWNCAYGSARLGPSCAKYYRLPVAGYSFEEAQFNDHVAFTYKIEAAKTKWTYQFGSADSFSLDGYIDSPSNSPYNAISLMNSAFLRWMVNTSNVSMDSYSINAGVAPVTFVELNTNARDNILGQFCAFALAYALIYPFFLHRIVVERSGGLMEVSRMAGLSNASYWASMFLSDYLHYLGVTIVIVIIGFSFGFKFLLSSTATSWLLYVVLALGGLPVLSVSYAIGVLFKSINTAFLTAYIVGIAQGIFGIIMNVFVITPGVVGPAWFSFFPPFAFQRALFVIAHHLAVPRFVPASLAMSSVGLSLLYMIGFSLAFFLIALYIDQILPKSEGMRRPFYFPITDTLKACGVISSSEIVDDESQHHNSVILDTKSGPLQTTDDDVASEKSLVIQKAFAKGEQPVVIIDGLNKSYAVPGGKPFKAVDGVWFHINDGECFGLLGPNGAGKTTLVNMLVGLLLPSSGRASIGGLPISQKAFTASAVIGLCPQFDILYDDLTVEEHLLFHVRLKGFPKEYEQEHVQQIIDEIGLQGERRRLASALSGGQRRRLSIGIALSGNPQFVLLDEPTSGLDPGSKRAVWDVIRIARAKRCFLLTTHSMEEAEVLCTRIGIMAGGELKCIGTQQHLKSKYGEGFKIDVMYQSGEMEKADAFITATIPEAKLSVSAEGYLSYQAPKSITLSSIFTKVESQKRRHGIINWGISQANLEQVFLTIVRQAEAQAGEAPQTGEAN